MIYKGCQKKMILLRDPSGKLFEEAYFILRDDLPTHAAESDMVREANRIIREATSGKGENIPHRENKRTFNIINLLWMFLGFAGGVGASLMVFAAL